MPGDLIQVALLVARALDAGSIRHVVGGSVASSISGEPRSTLDVDIVVAMPDEAVDSFLEALGPDFHADQGAIRRAIRQQTSANLIHRPTGIKVDLFIMGGTPIDERQMDRRCRVQVGTSPEQHLYIYTPEDILLQKLRWFRLGHEVSDRQWRDVLGILVVQGTGLDLRYLRECADQLHVADLLERALLAAGPPGPQDTDDA